MSALVLVGSVTSASAQTDSGPDSDAPAHIAIADGTVLIERETDTIEASSGEPLVPGDRVRADSGRADVWFDDGTAVAIDARSVLEFGDIGLLRLTAGRILVSVARGSTITSTNANSAANPSSPYRIDTPLGSASLDGPGDYLIDVMQTARGEYLAVSVLRGAADVIADGGTMRVRSGERAYARLREAPSYPERFNSARLDDFEQWALSLRDDRRGRTTSTRYLPPNLQVYGKTFDRDGSWEYESAYGYVWYPVVDAGWRPYYNGYWRPLPRYGWTWVAGDRWGWPTHHYGRWGYNRSRWFWIPERAWGPAWVSWASAADYVSWCPLGFDNRPVFGFSLSVGNTWAGWTLLPRQSFGGRTNWVTRAAVDGRRLPRNTAFALHAQAPVATPVFRGRDRRDDRDRFDRGSLRDGRRDPAASASAVPRAGDRPVAPRDSERRGAVGDARRRNLPDDAPTMHGPGGPGGAVTADPYGDGGDPAVRRGSRRADRDGQRPAPPDDRPTPQAPRNGIYVDPGLPRSSDRMSPREREVMPLPPPDAGRVRRRNGDAGYDRDGDRNSDRNSDRNGDRNNDRRGNGGPGATPPSPPSPPSTPTTSAPPPTPSAPSQPSSAGVRVRRWGQEERPSPPPTRRDSGETSAPPPSAGRAVPRDGGAARGDNAPRQDGGGARGDSAPRQDGGARRRGR